MSEAPDSDFSRAFEAYHGKVLAFATRLIGAADADDVAQEVFLKVRRSLPDLRDPASFPAWIHTITLNAVRDAVRKRSLRTEETAADARLTSSADGADEPMLRLPDVSARTPEEVLIRREMVSCYLDFVNQLRPSYREVYLLSEVEQLSNAEIARRLALSLATVKIRLHRARGRLFEQLRASCRCYYNERGELMATQKGRRQTGD